MKKNYGQDPTPNNFPSDYDRNKVDPRVLLRTVPIGTKMYGGDTREAMQQAPEIVSVVATEAKEVSANTKERQNKLEKRWETVLAGTTDGAEIVESRVDMEGEAQPTLADRLIKDFTNLSSDRDQTYYLSLFFQKLRTGKQVKITVYGDSLTYGLDLTSPDRRPATPEQPNQESTRASKTYPEQLFDVLNVVFPNQVSIESRAIPGLTAEGAVTKWTETAGEDLAIYTLGTNDAKYGGMKAFQGAYRTLIQRSTQWKSGVICLLPPKQRSMVDVSVEVFRKAIVKLCDEAGVPYLDLGEELSNLPASYYSDTIHFTGKGYAFLGGKVGTFINTYAGLNANKISSGVLSTRDIDGLKTVTSCSYRSNSSVPSGDELESGKGVALIINPGGKAIYSFQTVEDNIVAYPNSYLGKTNKAHLKLSLDYNLDGQTTATSNLFDSKQSGLVFPTNVTYTTPADGNFYQTYYGAFTTTLCKVSKTDAKKIVIPRKGYHSILIENTGTEEIQFYGLEFMPMNQLNSQIRSFQKGSITKVLDASGNAPITKTTIPLKQLFDEFNVAFSDQNSVYNPTLRVVVQSTGFGTLEYIINVKSISAAGINFVSAPNEYKLNDRTKRTLASITFDTNGLTLNWANSTIPGNVTISVA